MTVHSEKTMFVGVVPLRYQHHTNVESKIQCSLLHKNDKCKYNSKAENLSNIKGSQFYRLYSFNFCFTLPSYTLTYSPGTILLFWAIKGNILINERIQILIIDDFMVNSISLFSLIGIYF